MGCQSDVNLGESLVFGVCTHDPDTGALTDADAAPIYRVYEDETAVPILTGTMAALDPANTDGFYTEQIDCTEANGFEAEKSYAVYIEATVNGDTGGICYGFRVRVPVGEEVWTYGTRTLTMSWVAVAAAVDGSTIAAKSYTTWIFNIADIGSLVGRDKLFFTIKEDLEADPDSEATCQIEESGGLLVMDASPGNPLHGTLVVNDAVTGDITVTVNALATGIGRRTKTRWGIKKIDSGVVIAMAEGAFTCDAPPTKAVT